MSIWPSTADRLTAEQERLASAPAPQWVAPAAGLALGGCFVCFPRGAAGAGGAGDTGWAAAALVRDGRLIATAVIAGVAGAAYAPGLLALREGPLLAAALGALAERPDVLIVNATGRDHPRRAGLALHLGAALGLPSIGVTHRLLLAAGAWPAPEPGARCPIRLDGELVGYWLRTRAAARPLAIHAGWRTSAEQAVEIAQAGLAGARTPEPLRHARRLARTARARAGV
jgi:deoxyribonuclease V